MQELYQDLGYQQKKTGWKFGVLFFTMIVILFILIGISIVMSIPIFVREKIESFIKPMGCRISDLLGNFPNRRNSSE
jgi:hypothetical protein